MNIKVGLAILGLLLAPLDIALANMTTDRAVQTIMSITRDPGHLQTFCNLQRKISRAVTGALSPVASAEELLNRLPADVIDALRWGDATDPAQDAGRKFDAAIAIVMKSCSP